MQKPSNVARNEENLYRDMFGQLASHCGSRQAQHTMVARYAPCSTRESGVRAARGVLVERLIARDICASIVPRQRCVRVMQTAQCSSVVKDSVR